MGGGLPLGSFNPLVRRATAAIIAALFLCALAPVTAVAAQPISNEYYLVVDTSGSMIGQAGGQNIFPDVKKNLNRFISVLGTGDSVSILPFDAGLGKAFTRVIRSDADKRALSSFVTGLKAQGLTTWIYFSLDKVLARTRQVQAASPGTDHRQTIYLFTDGKDESKKGYTLSKIIAAFELRHAENPNVYLKYITSGTSVDPAWEGIDGVEVLPFPIEPTQIFSIRVEPATLTFGNVRDAAPGRTIQLTFDPKLVGASVTLKASCPEAEKRGGIVSIEPSSLVLRADSTSSGATVMQQTVKLVIANKESLSAQAPFAFTGTLSLTKSPGDDRIIGFSPEGLPITFSVEPASVITLESPGRDGLAVDLGTLDPYKSDPAVAEIPLRATFNDRAHQSGASAIVRVGATTGPADGLLSFAAPDGSKSDKVALGPDSAETKVVVTVPADTVPGAYLYEVVVEPTNAEVAGVGVTQRAQAQGTYSFTVRFVVPAAPVPLAQQIIGWLGTALLVLLVLAILVFAAACVVFRTAPWKLAPLLMRKVRPRILDARFQLLEPVAEAREVDISGQRSYAIGRGTGLLSDMPMTVRLVPAVSLSTTTETLELTIEPDEATGVLQITRALSGAVETVRTGSLCSGDIVDVVWDEGATVRFSIASIDYMS